MKIWRRHTSSPIEANSKVVKINLQDSNSNQEMIYSVFVKLTTWSLLFPVFQLKTKWKTDYHQIKLSFVSDPKYAEKITKKTFLVVV